MTEAPAPTEEHLIDMPLAAEYPLMDIFWTMTLFFLWVIWVWILVGVLTDVFRRRDISGWGKAAWTLFVIVVPYLGVFAYLISQHDGMAERGLEHARGMSASVDRGPADEIMKAKRLLDDGVIDEREYASIKAHALA